MHQVISKNKATRMCSNRVCLEKING